MNRAGPVTRVLHILLACLLAQSGRAGRARGPGLAAVALCWAGMAACACLIICCLLAAVWIFAAPRVGQAAAPLIVACLLAVVAAALFAGISLRAPAPPPPPPPADTTPEAQIAALLAAFQDNKTAALLAALLAGLRAGAARD